MNELEKNEWIRKNGAFWKHVTKVNLLIISKTFKKLKINKIVVFFL